jgi:hypothetical protein
MKNKLIVYGALVLGVICIACAALYWLVPAGSLPQLMPGFEAGSVHIHFKHGLAALILGLGLFAFVWFQTGKKNN